MEPSWLATARSYIGEREVPGPTSGAWQQKMWLQLKGGRWYWEHFGGDDSSAPWCGAFMGKVFDDCRMPYATRWASARGWLDWGFPIPEPVVGCVTVLERGPRSGHVMFTVGRDPRGYLMGLGGNQRDAVTIAPFAPTRVLGHRWPLEKISLLHMMPGDLPLLAATGEPSRNEA